MTLIELLLSLGLITDEQAVVLTAVAGDDLTGVDTAALQDAADLLHDVADVVLDLGSGDQTDSHITVLEGAAELLTAIGGEQDTRVEAIEARSARIAELADGIRPAEPEIEPEPEIDVEVVDDASSDEDSDGDEGGEHVDETETPEIIEELVPVLAATPPRVGRVAARRPTAAIPTAQPDPLSDDVGSWGMVASANSPGFPAGAPIRSEDDLAEAFTSAWHTAEAFTGPAQNVRVLSMGGGADAVYGPDRVLGADPFANTRMISAAQQARQGLTASGGNPAPTENRYDIPVVGSEARPVRDSFLTRFGASRGGVRVITPSRLAAASGAASVHTDTNDIAGATKSFATVTAGAEQTQLVDAIVKRLQFGEFQDRYLPELVASWVKLAAVAHARLAEETLITSIAAAGTNVSAGDDIRSATRDILSQLDRLVIAVRSRERLGADFPFDVLLPDWVYGLIRVDLSRQDPGGGSFNDEALAVQDVTINRFFQIRNLHPVWSPDMQEFGEQGVGAIQGFPDTVVGHVAPAGGHVFLDGGSLNLGIVRDSTLNNTNDLQMFSETFEQHIYHHQVPAYQITMDVVPSGITAIPTAIPNAAVTGS